MTRPKIYESDATDADRKRYEGLSPLRNFVSDLRSGRNISASSELLKLARRVVAVSENGPHALEPDWAERLAAGD